MPSRKRIARITHERRYVIINLPLTWEAGDPLPPAAVLAASARSHDHVDSPGNALDD